MPTHRRQVCFLDAKGGPLCSGTTQCQTRDEKRKHSINNDESALHSEDIYTYTMQRVICEIGTKPLAPNRSMIESSFFNRIDSGGLHPLVFCISHGKFRTDPGHRASTWQPCRFNKQCETPYNEGAPGGGFDLSIRAQNLFPRSVRDTP